MKENVRKCRKKMEESVESSVCQSMTCFWEI